MHKLVRSYFKNAELIELPNVLSDLVQQFVAHKSGAAATSLVKPNKPNGNAVYPYM